MGSTINAMTDPVTYSRTPLVEVVLDIRVSRGEPPPKDALYSVGEQEFERYPQRAEQVTLVSELVAGETDIVAPITRQEFAGFRFTSADGKQLFHAQNDGFSCNRLAPYVGWATFSEEARRLWRVYSQLIRPTEVTRVAVRYINRFNLQSGSELADYFRTYPEVSAGLSQELTGVVMRLVLPQPDIVSVLVIQQTMLDPEPPDITPLVLDLDHFQFQDMPLDEVRIWRTLESLHGRAVQAFEACITDRTREMIV